MVHCKFLQKMCIEKRKKIFPEISTGTGTYDILNLIVYENLVVKTQKPCETIFRPN